MTTSTSSSRQREDQLKAEVKKLTEDSQKSAREVRELTAKLVALQARSPEVGGEYIREWLLHIII